MLLFLLAFFSGLVVAVSWEQCKPENEQVSCATYRVPKDWSKPDGTQIDLHLTRVSALLQPAKGSIFFNFGGPGEECGTKLVDDADVLLSSTGGMYDLITIEPRGTASTLSFNCQDSLACRKSPSSTSLPALWHSAGVYAHACAKQAVDIGKVIGTAFTVRDLMAVVNVTEEDQMLRFWGMSYGSILGATAAAMFPDRIDRLVIDGVPNIEWYYKTLVQFDHDPRDGEVFSHIWTACMDAGPQYCPLAAHYTTPTALEADVWRLFDSLEDYPMIVANETMSLKLNQLTLRVFYVSALYNTDKWPHVVKLTGRLLHSENSSPDLVSWVAANSHRDTMCTSSQEAPFYGIGCADLSVRANQLERLAPAFRHLLAKSRLLGPSSVQEAMICAQWEFKDEELYHGPWANLSTRAPLLILANTHDAVTPIAGAHEAKAIFKGSSLVELDGYGHTSSSLQSQCLSSITAAYFQNGTLPARETVCDVDQSPVDVFRQFKNKGRWAEV